MKRNKSQYTIYNIRHTGAYTLIELLIVITISIIIFSVGIVGYREFSRRQALTGITKQIKADLRLTQQLALTGQKPTEDYQGNSVTCSRLSSYTFTRINSVTYQIIANCTNTNSIIKNIDMPEDTIISAGNIVFKALGQGTSLSSPLTYTITNTQSSTTNTIVVGVGGDIQ